LLELQIKFEPAGAARVDIELKRVPGTEIPQPEPAAALEEQSNVAPVVAHPRPAKFGHPGKQGALVQTAPRVLGEVGL
jgi:hypothetical protein